MNYRDHIIEQLRRKKLRQQAALDITCEHLREMEDLRDAQRIAEAAKTKK